MHVNTQDTDIGKSLDTQHEHSTWTNPSKVQQQGEIEIENCTHYDFEFFISPSSVAGSWY